MDQDDVKPWDKVKLPTDEQVSHAVNVVREAGVGIPDNDPSMRALLTVLLNKDKILGFGHDS
jgi:hypothetical protein